MLTLSRAYSVPTYLILAVATAYLRFAAVPLPAAAVRVSVPLVWRLGLAASAFLAATWAFVRFTVG
jgi:hypothetical protein